MTPTHQRKRPASSEHKNILDLPGFDVNAALGYMGGNQKIYLTMLTKFYDSYASAISDIRDHLDAGETKEAHLLSHSLKGLTGLIGATRLNEAVVILDSLLSEGEQEGAPKALERCQEEMKLVLTVLKQWYCPQPKTTRPTQGEPRHGSRGRIHDLFYREGKSMLGQVVI